MMNAMLLRQHTHTVETLDIWHTCVKPLIRVGHSTVILTIPHITQIITLCGNVFVSAGGGGGGHAN